MVTQKNTDSVYMSPVPSEKMIEDFFYSSAPFLNEKQQRLVAASFAKRIGRGGQTIVHKATGMSYERIRRGLEELEFLQLLEGDFQDVSFSAIDENECGVAVSILNNPLKSRLPGGGRLSLTEKKPELTQWIEEILQDCSYGDPMSSLRWTTASLSFVREVLIHDYDYPVCRTTISKIIKELGYSLQENKKMIQVGKPHPDRDKQFQYMNTKRDEFLSVGDPVISTDTKKKEIIGNYANDGREYRRKGDSRLVLDHDFQTVDGKRGVPYGIYVVNSNHGYVNLGTSYDTAMFSSESIRKWWLSEGKQEFPGAKRILILCDGGGSNGSRSRLWKWQLGKIAQELGISINVTHFPPGTSKWNLVEHRLFSEISKNWKGKPLTSLELMLGYITGTTTKTGLYVHGDIDYNVYGKGIKISKAEMKRIVIRHDSVCPQWNYCIEGIKAKN